MGTRLEGNATCLNDNFCIHHSFFFFLPQMRFVVIISHLRAKTLQRKRLQHIIPPWAYHISTIPSCDFVPQGQILM